jgi:hypothetical protein
VRRLPRSVLPVTARRRVPAMRKEACYLPPQTRPLPRHPQVTRAMPSAEPAAFATILSSLGRIGARPPRQWLDGLACAAQPLLASFSPRDFAGVLSGFAGLRYQPREEWMFDFLLEARTALPRFTLREVVQSLRALAALHAAAGAPRGGGPPAAGAVRPRPGRRRGAGGRVPAEWIAALLVRGRVCLGNGDRSSSGPSGFSGGTVAGTSERIDLVARARAVQLLVSTAQLGVPPGAPLLAAALSRVLGVRYSPALGMQARGGSGRGGSGGGAEAPPSAPALDTAAAEWLGARPRDVARLLLALSSFWVSSGEACAWLRVNVRAVGALAALARAQLASAEPGMLLQLLQALAGMRYHPGPEWLAAHEARVLEQLDRLTPAALQGLAAWYAQLKHTPHDALREAAARGATVAALERRAAVAAAATTAAARDARRRQSMLEVQRAAEAGRLQQGGQHEEQQQQALSQKQRRRQRAAAAAKQHQGPTPAPEEQQAEGQ